MHGNFNVVIFVKQFVLETKLQSCLLYVNTDLQRTGRRNLKPFYALLLKEKFESIT